MEHPLLKSTHVSTKGRPSRAAPTAPTRSRILVVDDDPGICEVIQTALEEEGHEVTTVHNGQEALACLVESTSGENELVLLDLNMPIMTGWECIEQIALLPAPPPVIIMTAGTEARQEATLRGAAGFLAKPFDLDELGVMVQRVLHDSSAAAAIV